MTGGRPKLGRRRAVLAVTAVLVLLACGGGATHGPTAHPIQPLDRVERLLPPGASWVIISRPADLWRSAAVRRALTPVMGDDDLAAYATRTGIHLASLSELAAGSYGPRGTLVALRGPESAKSIRQTLALSATRPFDMRPLRRDVALVASGDDTRALLDEGRRRAGRQIPELPSDLTALRMAVGAAPLQVLVPVPLEVERDTPAAVLLSGVRRAAVAATPRGAEVAFRVVLIGDFPPTAAQNFRTMLESMADATLGEIFGLREVAETARIEASETRVTIDSALAAASVASGIETLFTAKLRELLGGPTK